ncbi:uncharacterized protein YdaU (DUF1376 family) [Mesorhizobium loti]|jgi:uncharacterized protein YdaU (DUF1376 family)|uniref:Uncharacterized protein YdaU (DUF1376 family) n=1 Tax=Rhizobium loti TaxID=381 RepID=A0A8E2WHW3_RHILI|nr:DUF1376 domain-containing protein [Mesorhizobium loti]PWJ94683.1 uncharacterized protein YdaU (DUF1376 family) [Mesorhizobium loti]
MSERPFMQLYVSDFVGDTLQLSTEQIGAYMLLLMAMWNAGGSLPDDDARLARVARLSLKKWRALSPDLLTFFERAGGEIGHKRLTKELRKAQVKSQARAAAGARGGAATALKTKTHAAANAGGLPRHLPDSRNQMEKAAAFSPDNAKRLSSENAQHFSLGNAKPADFSPAGKNKTAPVFSGRKPGWHQPKTHTDAANAIIEEIRRHDRSRIAAGDQGVGRDVLMLPAIRAD